ERATMTRGTRRITTMTTQTPTPTVNAAPTVMAAPHTPWPPAPPRPRPNATNPPAELVAALVGAELAQPLSDAGAALAEALAAAADLEVHRPGPMGTGWREALAADSEAWASGGRPKVLAAERLLDQDAHRWAVARASADGCARVIREALARLDRRGIAAKA